jgi:sn-glycerol 3-phosphate transport system permease protein
LDGSFQTIFGSGLNIGAVIRIIPKRLTLVNYKSLLEVPYLTNIVVNTFVVLVGYVVGGLVINGLVAYAFAFYKFKWKKVFYLCAMATVFIPASTIIVPRYIMVKLLGMPGIPSVLLMVMFDASTIFMLRAFFESIPMSLIEIAKIDGAKDWKIFSRVVIPLSTPIIAAASIFRSVNALGDFLWQMVNLLREEERTLVVGLYNSIFVRGLERRTTAGLLAEFGYSLTVGVVLMLPILVIFAFTSKYFVSGLTLGAVKE